MNVEFDEIHLGRRLGLVAKMYLGTVLQRLKHLDIGPYFMVLVIANRGDGEFTQQDIANECQFDKTNMVRIIDGLSEKGYLKRVPKENDRRAYSIVLTTKAKQILPEIYAAIKDLNKQALKGLSKKEVKIFYEIIDKVEGNIAHLPSEEVEINIK
ncbi:MarR family transcriptional regulator [Candidatus Amoebophilus asiaticus]|nr:MarR family transcriptional regulator [Candidatus Amoebophilus asiaticus]